MGKADKLRDCPAVGCKISGQECGSKRGTVYDCPSTCPHFPWTLENYDQALEIVRRFDGKLLDFSGKTVGRSAVMQRLRPDAVKDEVDEMEFVQRCHREFYRAEVRPGKTLFDVWRDEGWSGLRNDEIYLAHYAVRTRAAVIEVRRVIDDVQCECIDLLADEGDAFIVCDRALAGEARLYQAFCAWLTPGPFFERVQGVAFALPLSPESARSAALRHVESLGGPVEGAAEITAWLGENMVDLVRSLNKESADRMERVWRNLDVKQCVATYRFRGNAEDLGLSGREDFDEIPPDAEEIAGRGPHRCFVWLRTGPSLAWEKFLPEALQGGGIGPGVGMWGHLRIFDDRAEISAMSAMHFEPMKEMLAEFFGDRFVFEKEFVADIAKQTGPGRQRARSGDRRTGPEAVPSPEAAAAAQSFIRAHYAKFLGEPVPALDGLTPREAAAKPEMRGRLVDLMKGHLQSVDNLGRRNGGVYDIGWVLEDLGLHELAATPHSSAVPPRPRHWWRVLGEDDVVRVLEDPGRMNDQALSLSAPELVDHIDDFAGRFDLSGGERGLTLMLASMVLEALLPPDMDPPYIDHEEMENESVEIFRRLAEVDDHSERLTDLVNGSSQPALIGTLAAIAASAALGKEKVLRPFGRVRSGMAVVIVVEIEALIRCLRRSALG